MYSNERFKEVTWNRSNILWRIGKWTYLLAHDHLINTAVHVAAQEGQLVILKYFIEEKKADVNVYNEIGETPLFSAAEKPYIYVIMYLIEECHADPTVTDSTQDNILL